VGRGLGWRELHVGCAITRHINASSEQWTGGHYSAHKQYDLAQNARRNYEKTRNGYDDISETNGRHCDFDQQNHQTNT